MIGVVCSQECRGGEGEDTATQPGSADEGQHQLRAELSSAFPPISPRFVQSWVSLKNIARIYELVRLL